MKTAWKLIICWVAFVIALFASSMFMKTMHLPEITPPGGTSLMLLLLAQLLAGAIIVLGLYPMAQHLRGDAAVRAMAAVAFLFLVLGVNDTIEARVFTNFVEGKIASVVLYNAVQAILVGIAVGMSFGASGQATGMAHRGWLALSSRGIIAWLAWPVIYFVFGMLIAPIVLPYYNAGIAGLRIPAPGTIVTVQLIRGLVFLAASLPLVALWKGSRLGLWGALGLAHAAVVGISGLAGATFFPWVLRITHSVEITADSFAYAGLLVLLFAAPSPRTAVAEPPPTEAHPLPL